MDSQLILGIIGSPRSKGSEQHLKKIIEEINDDLDLNTAVEIMARDQTLSNSEICLMASMFGVKKQGMNFEIIKLKNYIKNDSIINSEKLEKLVSSAGGMVIASPVYFGDRTYLVNLFMEFLKQKALFKGKIVGCVSVGAKRNGGQETTNIYICKEANDAGAFVVGNGPPTSQYGGTAWAGNIGAIREDEFGISTSLGTGKKVSEAVSLINAKEGFAKFTNVKISFWVMKDANGMILKEITKLKKSLDRKIKQKFLLDVIDFTKMKFSSCVACGRCPWYHSKKDLYKCKIKKDDFASAYERMVNTDAIIICGYHPTVLKGVKDVYQKTLERTRMIRRDNFLLSNIPITSYSIEELPNDNLFSLKVMTSFLRHNTIISPPLKKYIPRIKKTTDLDNSFLDLIHLAIKIKASKESNLKLQSTVYLPVGYTN